MIFDVRHGKTDKMVSYRRNQRGATPMGETGRVLAESGCWIEPKNVYPQNILEFFHHDKVQRVIIDIYCKIGLRCIISFRGSYRI